MTKQQLVNCGEVARGCSNLCFTGKTDERSRYHKLERGTSHTQLRRAAFCPLLPRGGSRQGRQPAGRESPGRAANGGAAVAAPSPRSAGGGAASGGRAGGAAGAPPAGGAPAARRARRPLGGARGSAAGSGELGPTAQGAEQGQCSYFLFYFILF